jgi:hypothetical protein
MTDIAVMFKKAKVALCSSVPLENRVAKVAQDVRDIVVPKAGDLPRESEVARVLENVFHAEKVEIPTFGDFERPGTILLKPLGKFKAKLRLTKEETQDMYMHVLASLVTGASPMTGKISPTGNIAQMVKDIRARGAEEREVVYTIQRKVWQIATDWSRKRVKFVEHERNKGVALDAPVEEGGPDRHQILQQGQGGGSSRVDAETAIAFKKILEDLEDSSPAMAVIWRCYLQNPDGVPSTHALPREVVKIYDPSEGREKVLSVKEAITMVTGVEASDGAVRRLAETLADLLRTKYSDLVSRT